MYAVSHSDYWNRNISNYGQWFIYEVNPSAAAYDSPGKPVSWMERSTWQGNSKQHLEHNERMEKLARIMCEALNKSENSVVTMTQEEYDNAIEDAFTRGQHSMLPD